MESVPVTEGIITPVRLFGASGSLTPVIMVHGLQSHSGWFSQSAAFIARLGHPVYVVDRRGSGLSLATRGDSKDFMEWAEEIRAVAERAMADHDHGQVFILGHCFGAIPATVYAELYPDTVRGLILTTPGIYTHTSIPFSQILKIATTRAGERNYYLPVPLDSNQFSELAEYEAFIAADPLALRAVTGDLYWQVSRARDYVHDNSERLTMPVLVSLAGEDVIADNRKNSNWLSALPARDKTQIVYVDARHILEYSLERDKFFHDLGKWLSRIERD